MSELKSGWVLVGRPYRLWSDVRPEERVTEKEIVQHHFDGSPYGAHEIDRLRNPVCEIASQRTEYGRRWLPCLQPVARAANRCKWHGGPSANPALYAAKEKPSVLRTLKAENDLLKQRLAELEARGGEAS